MTTAVDVDTPVANADADAEGRLRRLSEAVKGLGRSRSTTMTLDRWLLIAGSVLMPLGVVLVLLGWYGAAHTGHVFEQIPYLISGGLLGLALVVAGGFCYFGFWLTKLVYEGRQQHDALMAAIDRLAPAAPASPAPSTNGSAKAFVATATGTMFHRPDCRLVAGKDSVRPVDPAAGDLQPCRVCDPLG